MPAPARIMDLAAGVAANVADRWDPAAPDLVHAVWYERFTLNVNAPDTLLTGRRVAVIPALPELATMTRGHRWNKYTVGVVLVERYTDAGVPTDEWVGERAAWWEQTLFYPLWHPELVITGPAGIVTAAQPDPETPPEVTEYLDRDKLTDLKLLYIAANFTFADATDLTGAD